MAKKETENKQDKPLKSQTKDYKAMFPNGGRPPTFIKPEEMQKKIHNYFNEGVKVRQVIVGSGKDKRIEMIPVPTITGLALYLGFSSRTSFYEYEDREGFANTVKRARAFIEREYEEQLQHGNTTGAIFALKNMGWIDSQDINLNKEQPLFGPINEEENEEAGEKE